MTERIAPQPIDLPLRQLYCYVTDTCNLHCRHCWIEPHDADGAPPMSSIPPDLFASVLDEALPLGLQGVKLTGGEPLLHPRIGELLAIVRQKNLDLTVETNGVLCRPEIAAQLAAVPNVFVSVSLDGARPETHDWIRGNAGSFAKAIDGIGHLIRCGVRPQIIMTVMRRNKDELEGLVRLAEFLGAGSVKFNILQPTARGKGLHEKGEALDVPELIALGRWVDGVLSAGTAMDLCFHQPPSFLGLEKMFGRRGDGYHTCGIMGILGVLWDGSYSLCGIGATVPELIFGRAGEHRLSEIWLEHPTLLEIRQGLPQRLTGVCARCVLNRMCLGSCIAQNYYRSGNLWTPFWYCEEAHRRGIFPKTRLRPEQR